MVKQYGKYDHETNKIVPDVDSEEESSPVNSQANFSSNESNQITNDDLCFEVNSLYSISNLFLFEKKMGRKNDSENGARKRKSDKKKNRPRYTNKHVRQQMEKFGTD